MRFEITNHCLECTLICSFHHFEFLNILSYFNLLIELAREIGFLEKAAASEDFIVWCKTMLCTVTEEKVDCMCGSRTVDFGYFSIHCFSLFYRRSWWYICKGTLNLRNLKLPSPSSLLQMLHAHTFWLRERCCLGRTFASRMRCAASSVQGRFNGVGWFLKRFVLLTCTDGGGRDGEGAGGAMRLGSGGITGSRRLVGARGRSHVPSHDSIRGVSVVRLQSKVLPVKVWVLSPRGSVYLGFGAGTSLRKSELALISAISESL